MNILPGKTQFLYTALPEVAAAVLDLAREHYVGRGAYGIALVGDLGAGKTALAQAIATQLGITDVVQSPTFVIQKTYTIPQVIPGISTSNPQAFQQLMHIDAYRLETEADAVSIRMQDAAVQDGLLVLVEWPERLPGFEADMRIELSHDMGIPEDMRTMNVTIGKGL
jgi:tRNA threonylcarbamoyladenosine biosynthesis protein TsaE